MRLAAIVTARPSYSRIRTALLAIQTRGVDVQVVACASALLERYGRVVEVIRRDGLSVEEVWSTYEGTTRLTSAMETGALCTALAPVLARLKPDAGLVIADRHEVLGAAQAVAYQHIPLFHIQGGERTGSIDDKVRDSITHLADYHLVATESAKYRVYGLTGALERIYQTGCPSVDLAREALAQPPVTWDEIGGVGPTFPLDQPFVVLLQHPVTSEPQAPEHLRQTLQAIRQGGWACLAIWPGQDAGSEASSKMLRLAQPWLHTVRNLAPARFLRLLTQASCLVGNSSVGIRECSYLGVPVVNIGTRQQGRERGRHVRDVPQDVGAIGQAMVEQMQHGPYRSSTLYGDGFSGPRIAEVVCERFGLGVDPGPERVEVDPI